MLPNLGIILWIVRHACDTLDSDHLQDQQNRRGSRGELFPLRFPHQNRAQPRVMFCPGSRPAGRGWALPDSASPGQLRGRGRSRWPASKDVQRCVSSGNSSFYLTVIAWGSPRGDNGRESVCQCRRRKRPGFNPWVGKIPWRRAWQPTAVFLPGEPWTEEPGGLQSTGSLSVGQEQQQIIV